MIMKYPYTHADTYFLESISIAAIGIPVESVLFPV